MDKIFYGRFTYEDFSWKNKSKHLELFLWYMVKSFLFYSKSLNILIINLKPINFKKRSQRPSFWFIYSEVLGCINWQFSMGLGFTVSKLCIKNNHHDLLLTSNKLTLGLINKILNLLASKILISNVLKGTCRYQLQKLSRPHAVI